MAERVITEAFLRTLFLKGAPETFCLGEGQILTPAAAQFLAGKKVQLLKGPPSLTNAQGAVPGAVGGETTGYLSLLDGRQYAVKPEHLTHLSGNRLVPKDHPRIIFRGKLDSFQAEVLLLQKQLSCQADLFLCNELGELLARARAIMRADVLGEVLQDGHLLGLDEEQLREQSHNPGQYLDSGHLLLSIKMDPLVLALNRLRTLVREVEISALTAFVHGSDDERTDIVQALNRMSSAIYVMMLRAAKAAQKGGGAATRSTADIVETVLSAQAGPGHEIPVELSARHAHLSAEDVQRLFGRPLTMTRELSQPGQYLCRERVRLIGPGGSIEKVAVLGPARGHTQVEISLTDARVLGVAPPVRQSGDTAGAGSIQIASELETINLEEGLIIPGRHIHMQPQDARNFGLRDKDFVRVRVGTARALVFEDVLVRVNDDYRLAMHIDFDEGNACGWVPGTTGCLLK